MMSRADIATTDQPFPATLRFRPTEAGSQTAAWRINGYKATIFVWTSEEWGRLKVRPNDAQYYPCGIWCALRLDD